MNKIMNKINRYESDIFDFDISPFELIQILHLRSKLEIVYSSMGENEKLALLTIDLKVIKNAQRIVEHIEKVYDFSNSNHPISEWWWHLDKVANGEFIMKSYQFIKVV